MDQTQWKALNQMIAKQTSSGTSQKASSSGAAQAQYKTVLAGNQQQQHIILSGNSTQATTSAVGRPSTAGQRVAQRQSVNGATRSQPTGAGDTEIVKSLLTGRQYGQSILRPDIVSRGGRQGARSGAQKAAGKQVSLLQTNYQQSQIQVDAGQTSSIQLDQNLLQQLVCSPEMMSAAPGPGEVMYVMAGNVTYQIVGPSHPGAEVTAIPVASGISLDELATISAQQESLKPDQLAGYQLQAGDASSATMVLQDMLQTGLDGQQYLQAGLDGTITTTTDDGMQIVMMSGDGYGGGTESMAQFVREGDGASTIKLGGQDFILQAGQTLPPELQEMVDKGLPIDWSKYEFVIEGGENGPETTDAATFMMAQASADQSEALQLQEMALLNEAAGTGAEVGAFAAGADYVKTESQDEMATHSSIGVQFVTAAPGEYDDGEFSYLASPAHDEDPSQASGEVEPRVIPYSGFLHSFLDFVQGKGTETLSSVANSTVMGKPAMPKYVPPETGSGSKTKDDLQKKYKGTPMTIIYTDASDPTGGSYIVTKSVEDPMEKGKQSVGKRKRSQLDSESEDGSLENVEKMYRLSEDDFDSKKADDSYVVRGRGRGRGRSSSAGRPSGVETDRHLGTMSLLESTVPDSAVIHVTQSEPHCFQKGDFVIDRKDAYKLDSYPIWRIENGKLLQKFDPSFEDGILVHKSASVYSSWSGDIRDNFKPIMVEVISQTATTVGRKQDITVHVLEKYKTKAPDDSLEQNPLLQLFNIYVQMLLNHAVDSNYLLAVQEQKVDYYLTPMNQIDHLIIEAEQAVLTDISWLDDFKTELDAWSCYAVVGLRTDQVTFCQATPGSSKGIMTVKFYGQTYDRNFLTVESETAVANAKEFVIGKTTFDNLGIYHSLHHFKFLLFRKCREEVNYVKNTTPLKSYEDAIDECIQNRIWVQQLFLDLKGLLERYIIIKTEDEAMEEDTSTAGAL